MHVSLTISINGRPAVNLSEQVELAPKIDGTARTRDEEQERLSQLVDLAVERLTSEVSRRRRVVPRSLL